MLSSFSGEHDDEFESYLENVLKPARFKYVSGNLELFNVRKAPSTGNFIICELISRTARSDCQKESCNFISKKLGKKLHIYTFPKAVH